MADLLPAPIERAIRDLPRERLITTPSPLERLDRLAAALGDRAELWVKREDLLPLAFGGNKLRNLEFLLGAALADGADTVITSGRRWSNHARLTAAAGARLDLGVHLVLSGPPADNPGRRLDELLGATVHQLPSADRDLRDGTVSRLAIELRQGGRRPYVIPVGGSGLPGAWGQVVAAAEVLGQTRALRFEPDVIVLPSASGGTQAGLLAGLRASGSEAEVVGVLAARPAAELRPSIEATLAALGAAMRLVVDPAQVELDGTQLGGGYGVRSAAADEATSMLAKTEGLLVDPIYTAKALAGLIAAVHAGRFDGQRVVFWHAGGLPGLFEPLDG